MRAELPVNEVAFNESKEKLAVEGKTKLAVGKAEGGCTKMVQKIERKNGMRLLPVDEGAAGVSREY